MLFLGLFLLLEFLFVSAVKLCKSQAQTLCKAINIGDVGKHRGEVRNLAAYRFYPLASTALVALQCRFEPMKVGIEQKRAVEENTPSTHHTRTARDLRLPYSDFASLARNSIYAQASQSPYDRFGIVTV